MGKIWQRTQTHKKRKVFMGIRWKAVIDVKKENIDTSVNMGKMIDF